MIQFNSLYVTRANDQTHGINGNLFNNVVIQVINVDNLLYPEY